MNNSFFFPNVDAIYLFKRAGTTEDPFIPINQELTVNYGKVTLTEIPNYKTKVNVTNSNSESLIEITTTEPNTNEFKVDYSTGMVYFNSAQEDSILTFSYLGIGQLDVPAGRMILDTSNTNGERVTLQEVLDSQGDIGQRLTEANDKMEGIETLVNANQVVKQTDFDSYKSDNNTKVNNTSTDLTDRGINIKTLGADSTGVLDISDYLKTAATMVVRGDIVLPRGTFNLAQPVVFNSYVRLKGQGNNVTTIKVTTDIAAITFSGGITGGIDSYLQNASCGIEGLTLAGRDENTKPLLSVMFSGRIKFSDVIFSHNGGGALYLRSVQDTMFLDCHFRYCGNKTINTAAVFMDDYSVNPSASNQMNVNELKFVGCVFEHNTGRLLQSTGNGNNSSTFTSCKFEYNGASGDPVPIYLKNAERFIFIDCRYTGYDLTGMFDIDNCYGIEIRGMSYNNNEPTFFARINNSRGISIRGNGRKVGKIIKTGSTYNLDIKLNEQEHVGRFYNYITSTHAPGESVDLRNIHYPDGGATIVDDATGTDGVLIRQTTAGKQLFIVNINNTVVPRNGITIWARINATVNATHAFWLQATYGSGTLFQNITINAGETWVRISIPKHKLPNTTALAMVTPSGFSGTVELKQMFYENRYYASAIPTSTTDSWLLGEEIFNFPPSPGGYEKWICTAAGAPGTWKGVNQIQA
ncbi:right-handed parallel beta-helix repeat-containing protein [Niallia taxi]|uniref:right-handed parallel beta-helix repeat-containing protein n=1 Tax=Niallia taxi TaxID=2499688 RepID=UPI00300856A7